MIQRRLAVLLLSIIAFSGLSVQTAQADVTDNAVQVASTDSVFVDAPTQAAIPNVVSTLKSKLTPGDNIVIVMVEAGAADARTLGLAVDEATGKAKIVAVAVGDEVYAQSALLPNEQANDLMRRSKSITVTTVETLTRFVREVHDWQAKQPKPAPEVTPSKAENYWPIVAGALVGAVFSIFWARHLKRRKERATERLELKYAPETVVRQFEALQRINASIDDADLAKHVRQLCVDSDKCFKGLSPGELEYGLTEDALVRNLKHIRTLLEKYKEIGEESRYIKDASTRQKKIVDAIKDFGNSVYEAASKNSQKRISTMDVDIDILKFHNL